MKTRLFALLLSTALVSPAWAVQYPDAPDNDASPETSDRDLCLESIASTEPSYGIPEGLLAAIGLTESGRVVARQRTVWPWTVNAEGDGHFFETKEDAIAFVEGLQADGVTSIDVGCMQINLRHHPDAFATLEDAFDPATNVEYGAEFLTSLKGESRTWLKAVRRYHSATPEKGEAYGERVVANWDAAKSGDLAVAAADEATEAPEPTKGKSDTVVANALIKLYTPLSVQVVSTAQRLSTIVTSTGGSFAPKVVSGQTGLSLQDYR
jgi:Transglycosylase SLT domain